MGLTVKRRMICLWSAMFHGFRFAMFLYSADFTTPHSRFMITLLPHRTTIRSGWLIIVRWHRLSDSVFNLRIALQSCLIHVSLFSLHFIITFFFCIKTNNLKGRSFPWYIVTKSSRFSAIVSVHSRRCIYIFFDSVSTKHFPSSANRDKYTICTTFGRGYWATISWIELLLGGQVQFNSS